MRGFIFTVMFAALCYLTLLSAVFYLQSRGYASLSLANQTMVDANGEVFDDLSYDLTQTLGVRIQSSRLPAQNQTNITFADTLPSTLAFPSTEFGDWTQFVEEEFSPASNLNITMNYTEFQVRPRFIALPFNLSYGYLSLDKSDMRINGSSQVTNYSLTIRLNRDIKNTNGTNWTWSGSPTSLYISLDIEDSKGQHQKISGKDSGYIDPAQFNSATFYGKPSGTLTIEAGAVSGSGNSALRVLPSGLSARTNTTILLNGTPETTIYAPIWVTSGEQASNLILHRH